MLCRVMQEGLAHPVLLRVSAQTRYIIFSTHELDCSASFQALFLTRTHLKC